MIRRWGLRLAAVLAAALLVSTAIRVFWIDVYVVNQDSMDPTLHHGERVAVDKQYPGQRGPQSGDVIIFDGEGSFTPYQGQRSPLSRLGQQMAHWVSMGAPPQVFVKRVIGVGGDTVACCTDDGQLTLNGEPLEEPYLPPHELASELSFEAEVPEERMWVLGDSRSESVDSRALLGAPGGGMISEDRIIGQVTDVVWPLSERRSLEESL
ncbi:signal peptidase I [Nesterenkonia sp. NBAIMH1]|uniref:signal peptidase I n=1 Tax=Nesterenkonia sp. NBAIMH1 TaxID=2600320 RepID=UPI00143D1DCA|nr:signal peptidase I [Nesterenkonia sp. NBAIMH1]